MPTSKEFVIVAKFNSVLEAEIVRGVLESEGIHAMVTDANFLTVDPLAPAIGSVGLQVRMADAARALELVRAHAVAAKPEDEEDAGPYLAEDTCISCGAEFPEYLDRCPACGLSYS